MWSIPLFRPTWTSQARAFSGMPVAGHCSMAVAKASWRASSARSKSPRSLMRVASTRPPSCRNISSMTLESMPRKIPSPGRGRGYRRDESAVHGPDRADFDAAVPCAWNASSDRDCLIKVLHLDEVIAAELLARLGERSVAGHGLAVAHAHRRGGGDRPQPVGRLEVPGLHDGLGELAVFVHQGARRLGTQLGDLGFVGVDQ